MNKNAIKASISGNDFFSGLDAGFLDTLAAHAEARKVSKNHVLFHYGDTADHFYLILSGNVVVEVAAIEGPALELQDLGAGAIVGWSWLIPPFKWSFQARASAPTQVLEFDGKAILGCCEKDTAFGYELLKRFSALMSERLSAARRKMMEEWNPPGFA